MSKDRFDKIKKLARTSSVQPLYETPSGEEVTATAIVQGKIKPPKIWPANSYKPKSIYKRKGGGKNKKANSKDALNINKTSYRSDIEREIPPVRNMPVINLQSAPEPFFGYVPLDFTGSGDKENLEEFYWKEHDNDDNFLSNENNDDTFDLVNYLVGLSDNFDKSGKYFFSNFTDFIIKKAHQADDIDYSEYFNELLLKLNSSDLDMKTERIKKFVNRFSELINSYIESGGTVDEAKHNAYKEIIVSFKNNIGELNE